MYTTLKIVWKLGTARRRYFLYAVTCLCTGAFLYMPYRFLCFLLISNKFCIEGVLLAKHKNEEEKLCTKQNMQLLLSCSAWQFPSVADPGCLSRIQKQQQKRGVKKICCQTFFCTHKFHEIENYFIFLNAEEKNLGQFSKNYITFYPKNCH